MIELQADTYENCTSKHENSGGVKGYILGVCLKFLVLFYLYVLKAGSEKFADSCRKVRIMYKDPPIYMKI